MITLYDAVTADAAQCSVKTTSHWEDEGDIFALII